MQETREQAAGPSPSGNDGPSKKPYHTPELLVYGELRELTQAGAGGPTDGLYGT